MKNLKTIFLAVVCCSSFGVSYGGDFIDRYQIHPRVNAGFGPRYINNQVMSKTRWDTGVELGLGAFKKCKTSSAFYGLDARANNAWDARFNSVNDIENTTTTTLLVHNSASMDFMAFAGKEFNTNLTGEIGGGVQVSWVKWLGSPQQATDKARVLPKLRLNLSRNVGGKTKVYLAVNQSFNHYEKLQCRAFTANCFNDDGFVSVTDIKIGVNSDL